MPAYEYECANCGPFSARRSIAAFSDPADCPACGASAPRQLLSAPFLGGHARGAAPAPAGGSTAPHVTGCGCCGMARTGRLRAEAV